MKKLLIANRGEIARRVLRAGRARGNRLAVISTPEDRDALVRTEADEVLEVESFLDAGAIVKAAKEWWAELLHPGYGFLSENASFAENVEAAGIAFVGPTAESMRLLGDKERAKALARACDVPTLSALSSSEITSIPEEELEKTLEDRGIRPPYLVKAAGGGGGRGMRVAERFGELSGVVRRASQEAAAGFGDPRVFVENYLSKPRHIEVQVFGDGKGGVAVLGERECSMQRRHQKVVEEAPSDVVDAALRRALCEAAARLTAKASYRGAGTVEFLLDEESRFYFLEVNARLQVEHPVTEEVYGVDLVDAQLELAEGRWPKRFPDASSQTILEPQGTAIEARLLAEDPRQGFLPTPGPLVTYREPHGDGIRVDSGVAEGGRVNASFDSMIAKVIAHGSSREEAIERLSKALERMIVHGCTTNLPFLQALVRHPDFRAGRESTEWIAEHLDELNASLLPEPLERRLSTRGFRESLSRALAGEPPEGSPFAETFRAQGNEPPANVGSERELARVTIERSGRVSELELGGPGLARALAGIPPSWRYSGSLRSAAEKAAHEPESPRVPAYVTHLDPPHIAVTVFGETLLLDDPRQRARVRSSRAEDGEVRAPMAGKVLEVLVGEGDEVEEGQVLFVVESMKMQLEVNAPVSGKVVELLVSTDQVLDGPDTMAILE